MSTQSSNNQNGVKNAIKAYLDTRAQEDTLFAASYAKPDKNIDECFDYIIGEVRKKGNAVYMSDEEVFGMAVHYYDEDNIKVSKLPRNEQVRTAPSAVELTDVEKEEIKAQAIQAYKQRCIDEEAAKAKEQAKKRREAKRKAHEHEPQLFSASLFGEGEL